MALVLVGGQAKNIGKTSAVAALITAFSDLNWTAIKIKQFTLQEAAQLGTREGWSIQEELSKTAWTDSSRYLAAGAKRAYLVQSRPENLPDAVPELRKIIADTGNVIVESNTLARLIHPDLYLMLVSASLEDMKPSARNLLDKADAVITIDPAHEEPRTRREAKKQSGQHRFTVSSPEVLSPDVIGFVRERLSDF